MNIRLLLILVTLLLGCILVYVPQAHAAQPDNHKTFTDPTTGMEFVFIKGGCFKMGDMFGDGKDRGGDESPVHEVCVNDFYMGKYEVTNAKYRKFDSQQNSYTYKIKASRAKKDFKEYDLNGDNQPVIVTWVKADKYAKWLSQQNGRKYRLPTEAEWEYAARANTITRNYWGNDTKDNCLFANVSDISLQQAAIYGTPTTGFHKCNDHYIATAPVGSFKPNQFGLYDMMGNEWEWCSDWYDRHYYSYSQKNNPQGASAGTYRVLRGGGWTTGERISKFKYEGVEQTFYSDGIRVSIRGAQYPDDLEGAIGFRLVLDPN